MTAKEVWYVWGGKGGEPDCHKVNRVLLRNGLKFEGNNSFYWKLLNSDYDIVAYTLGETRKRAECEECVGTGCATDLDGGEAVFYLDEKCPDCLGRGYIWKMGVAS